MKQVKDHAKKIAYGAVVAGALATPGCIVAQPLEKHDYVDNDQWSTAVTVTRRSGFDTQQLPAQFAPVQKGRFTVVQKYDKGIADKVLGTDTKYHDALKGMDEAQKIFQVLEGRQQIKHAQVTALERITNDEMPLGYVAALDKNLREDRLKKLNDYLAKDKGIESYLTLFEEKKESATATTQEKNSFGFLLSAFKNGAGKTARQVGYLMMIDREQGVYDTRVIDAYRNLTRVAEGFDLMELGSEVVEDHELLNILDDIDLEDSTTYDVREATREGRFKLTDSMLKGQITTNEWLGGLFYLTAMEAKVKDKLEEKDEDKLTKKFDWIPFAGLVTTNWTQTMGYEGLNVDEVDEFQNIVLGLYSGLTDDSTNMLANDHRVAAGIAIGSAVATVGVAVAVSSSGGGGGGSGSGNGGGGDDGETGGNDTTPK